ncbi:DUF222 domain-containing protein [Rhodococcus sp. D2-41]|uniref:HNH endonuclease signature motif containing protein n=1 Tax=Speluncibacter jeojiensis TaxID=2710754 RepID=UPI00240FE1DE|nr:HNH endonuclease signature motif containing protein [Rhodococcus sp. D2-41]MDG3009549.1 DUF222 domain-containing protein [Rhodococcus sp. D2-41]
MSEMRTLTVIEKSLSSLMVSDLRDRLLESERLENRAHASRILATHAWAGTIVKTRRMAGLDVDRAERFAISEVAAALTCSARIARKYIDFGAALSSRLPLTRSAFHSGDIDHRRAETIWRSTRGVDPETIEAIEEQAVAAALRLPPGKLASEIERLLIEVDPEGARGRRRSAAGNRRVTTRTSAFGMAWLEAYLTGEEAVAVEHMIDEVADTVCAADPRDKQERRVDAFVALLNQEQFLGCRCSRGQACPVADQATVPARRKPHVIVNIDMATLLALADHPAVLAGYGPISPEVVRLLSQDATWQPFIAESRRLAQQWIGTHGVPEGTEAGAGAGGSEGVEADPEFDQAGVDAEADEPAPADEPYDEEYEDYIERCYQEFLSRPENAGETTAGEGDGGGGSAGDEGGSGAGAERGRAAESALGSAPLAGRACPAPRPLHYGPLYPGGRRLGPVYGDGAIIAAIEVALAADPRLRCGVYPDGHGGHGDPPPGALTYRPCAELSRQVRRRDGACRHPGCTVPARRCEIDHIVPFDHGSPRQGGWTIYANLHCLCKFHHDLKTWGLWTVTVLAGNAECWTSDGGQQVISLPAGLRTVAERLAESASMGEGDAAQGVAGRNDAAGMRYTGDAIIERPEQLRHIGPPIPSQPVDTLDQDDDPPPF